MLGAVAKTLKGAKLTSKMKPAQQHGLTGFVATGTGTKDGNEVAWFTSAIGDGKGHALLTLGMYRPTASPAYRAQMARILDSSSPPSERREGEGRKDGPAEVGPRPGAILRGDPGREWRYHAGTAWPNPPPSTRRRFFIARRRQGSSCRTA